MSPILSIILKRLLIGLLTLWIVTVIIFAANELLPGDIATEMLKASGYRRKSCCISGKVRSEPARSRVGIFLGWRGYHG